MVVSENNKSPSHLINLFNHHHSTISSSSSSSTTSPSSLTVPRSNDSSLFNNNNCIGRKVLGVILIDERMLIRHIFGGPVNSGHSFSSPNDLIDLEYKNYLLLGSIVVDREMMSIDELRRLISDQIANLPKSYAFFSKEG